MDRASGVLQMYPVGSGAAPDDEVIPRPRNVIGASVRLTVELIIPAPAVLAPIRPRATPKHVVPGLAVEVVAPATTVRVVVSRSPADGVVPSQAPDHVIAAEAHDHVIPRSPVDRINALRADDRRGRAFALRQRAGMGGHGRADGGHSQDQRGHKDRDARVAHGMDPPFSTLYRLGILQRLTNLGVFLWIS